MKQVREPVLDVCGRVWQAPLPPASFLGGRDLPPAFGEGTKANRRSKATDGIGNAPVRGQSSVGGIGEAVLDLWDGFGNAPVTFRPRSGTEFGFVPPPIGGGKVPLGAE